MSIPIMVTKLYIPKPRKNTVNRRRLINKLNEGSSKKLTLICAPAGYGKTTLVCEWLASYNRPAAWLSLEENDEEFTRFISYIIYSLQSLHKNFGDSLLEIFQSPELPPIKSILTALINELATIPFPFILVFDDFHTVHSHQVNDALLFILEHLPTQMHIVITTRDKPNVPLAKLRVRNELTELGAIDMKFTLSESELFLSKTMGLTLPSETIASLESRTEGWIAGLQLAALSIIEDYASNRYMPTFTGNHHFVLDYLVEEVLQRQSDDVRNFLLQTSIVDRLCAPLCEAVVHTMTISARDMLLDLYHKNVFVVPLDYERKWFRYHHLFAELLRHKLHESYNKDEISALHQRASMWLEANDLEVEAFYHALKAKDNERAAHLLEGNGIPLHLRGATSMSLKWLKTLSIEQLDARPTLWVIYGSALLMSGQLTSVEDKLRAGEEALAKIEENVSVRDKIGLIAATRATLASIMLNSNKASHELKVAEAAMQSDIVDHHVVDMTDQLVELIAPKAVVGVIEQQEIDTVILQSQRALQFLRQDNIPVRTAVAWMLGVACQHNGEYEAAREAYKEVITNSKIINHQLMAVMAIIGLGQIDEIENNMSSAAKHYKEAVILGGEWPLPALIEAKLRLERISRIERERIEQKVTLIEPLSQREIEVLKLIAMGLSNRDIGDKLYLALDTVKGHNRRIFEKLQVKSRTKAIARANELNLLSSIRKQH